MGNKLREGLENLKAQFACIGDIRGRGLMTGVEIVHDRRVSKEADIPLGKRLSAKMMELGLSATISARTYFSGCIRIAPPIVITKEELEYGLGIIEQALILTEGSLPLS